MLTLDEVERLRGIRERAGVLVALGSCACFGGVSRMKNDLDLDAALLKAGVEIRDD